jgi:hypothetical protein
MHVAICAFREDTHSEQEHYPVTLVDQVIQHNKLIHLELLLRAFSFRLLVTCSYYPP